MSKVKQMLYTGQLCNSDWLGHMKLLHRCSHAFILVVYNEKHRTYHSQQRISYMQTYYICYQNNNILRALLM